MGQNVLSNDFSWSKSRHEKFQDCRRAYYLHYYGSWGGWEDGARADIRQLWVLKKLANRFNWAGSVVHAIVKDALLEVRAGRSPDGERAILRARSLMRADFRHSRARAYWQERRRLEFMGLMEHEYQEPLPDAEWKRTWDNVETALRWFFRSPWLEQARLLLPHQWLEVDEGADHSWFEMDGVKMFAIPDFAFRDDDGRITVVDWKTGTAHAGYAEQVVGYALYLAHRHRVEPHDIRCRLVFLSAGEEVEVPVNAEAVQRFGTHFRESVQRMRELLVNAASNTPLDAEQFPMTEDVGQCARCAFRRACGREQVTFSALAASKAQAATAALDAGPSASAA
jgi:hypothetical protein